MRGIGAGKHMKEAVFSLLAMLLLAGCGSAQKDPPAGTPAASQKETAAASGENHHDQAKTIVFLGDSLTAGYGIDPSRAYPALIQEKIERRGWNFKVVNAGLSGDTSSDGLRRLGWVLKRRADVLVVELGANDGLRGLPVDMTRRNLQAIMDQARRRYPDIKLVVAGMMVPPNLGPTYTTKFREMFPQLARKNDALLIPFLLQDVAGKPSLNQNDGIHPTAAGHRIVAENVWKVMEPLLRSMAGSSN